MAEAVVSFCLNKVDSLLREQVKQLKGVKGDLRELRDELDSIRAFLKEADSRQESEKGVKAWVEQVRSVAYDIEDILDEFVLETQQSDHHHGLFGCLRKAIHKAPQALPLKRMCTRLQEIKTRIHNIQQRSERYRFSSSKGDSSSSSNDVLPDPRMASLYIEDTDFVSRDGPKNKLLFWLMKGESQRTVVSVVGMGGIGKTTLVKKVFDDKRVEKHFDCRAWIIISQSFRAPEVMKTMIKKFYQITGDIVPEGIDMMEEDQLIGILRNYLQSKRYVVVFDDVWHVNLWYSIQHTLPRSNNGSRVLVTTRNAEIASYCCSRGSSAHVCNLKPLPNDDAWELFCKYAFSSDDFKGQCPLELKEWSLKILKRCEGLPLAIVTIASLLSLKNKTVHEWKKLHDSLGSEMDANPFLTEKFNRVLLLSYNNLPYHLKHCFLYFSILPEDYAITSMRLCRFWIAEGFIEETKGKTLEEVAEDYLNELIRRNLVQMVIRNVSGQVRICRVHDLLREIILYKAKEERFCDVYAEQSSSNYKWDVRMRRLSIGHTNSCNTDIRKIIERFSQSNLLRSLFMFLSDNHLTGSLENVSFAKFKLLRVLDLQDTPLENFPNEIVNLVHLRYLSLRNTKIREIPKSMEKLRYLQTLDLKYTHAVDLPIRFSNLKELRHLLCTGSGVAFQGLRVSKDIACLTALQKLTGVNVEHSGGQLFVKELGKLITLRRFAVLNIRREFMRDLCASIEKMSNLLSLAVETNSVEMEEELIDLQHITSPPQLLQRLYLDGGLDKLPDWMPSVVNLVKLRLTRSKLRDNNALIRRLESLPNLVHLQVWDGAYDGEELHFGARGFPKLKFLKLANLDRLNSVTIEEGALVVLQKLNVGNCPMLKGLPVGTQHLKQLQRLSIVDMPKAFQRRVLLVDYDLLHQLPRVYFRSAGTKLSYFQNQFYKIANDLKRCGFGSLRGVCTCVSPFHHLFELVMQILQADKPYEKKKAIVNLINERRRNYLESTIASINENGAQIVSEEENPEHEEHLIRTLETIWNCIDEECSKRIEEDMIEVDSTSCWPPLEHSTPEP